MFLILLCASKVVIECDHKVCLSVNSVHIHMKGEAKIRSTCGGVAIGVNKRQHISLFIVLYMHITFNI